MRIAILGGGIGGLAAALALARPGRDVTVYERRTGFGESGAGIQLSPNATRILDALGVGSAVARSGCEPDGVVIRDLASGREIAGMALGPHMRQRFGAPYRSIARADLHTALLDAARARPGLRLSVGREATSLQDGPDGVAIELATASGGRERAEADLAIGADGLWSRVRAAVGDQRRPEPSGYVASRALVPASSAPRALAGPEVGLWLGAGRHVVHYGVGSGALINVVLVERRPERLEGWSGPRERDEVLAGLADAAPPLRALVGAAPSWAAWTLHDLPARTMGRGRIALLGDAAHPVLPYLAQGAALAIEDAATLAASLARHPADVPSAIRHYGRERLGRSRRVQAASGRNGRAYHAGWPVAAARNLVLRRLGPGGLSERLAWLYGWSSAA